MRKVVMISFVSVYLLFSIGIFKATHFCMGREASVAIFSTEAKKCPCSLYAGERGTCCDDNHELIRLDDEQKVIAAFSLAVPVWIELEKLYTKRLVASDIADESFDHLPDDLPPKVPLFKIHCSFVFYDDVLIG
jgi:hypothetical protein